ncbi:bifunctional adenosylcobinamide kinase/adenosylcobinamide-phosphate guanylyltransferase [Halomonas huangheensis]|uniref:Bifunctional adenosylcobalamin biosynthesis protein n=1 Tax=Halomonas huangheensis TaxID=1178482 RepID=W1N8Y1_9GAMM|nr:bifunctional adenosylcobinamide kinase/adenosylcobinamide-phosphate guanylyltransferase [Halomonas huangheensis]ALM53074.1 adenosylcobinamide kinase [Halomonas huangheensis]ERL51365.1 hypothetical protein BJB45_14330 [Halomonas huangheensis]
MIAFVSGGARSGKSQVAERLAEKLWRQRGRRTRLCYLATAARSDGEMLQRIDHHRERRGDDWVTLEAPVDLFTAWRHVAAGDTVLLDCLTLWASQLMFASAWSESDGRAMLQRLVADARQRDIALVVVSNDLNEELPPSDALVWQYLSFLQLLHRDMAQQADRVMEVVAGCPLDWKVQDPGVEAWERSPQDGR